MRMHGGRLIKWTDRWKFTSSLRAITGLLYSCGFGARFNVLFFSCVAFFYGQSLPFSCVCYMLSYPSLMP